MAFAGGVYTPRTHISIQERHWRINHSVIYPGSPAEGLLTNVRMVNCVFEDAGPAAGAHLPKDFDPRANTQRFIRHIPQYVRHGVAAFTISLQGGHPGYEGAVNSAFEADGRLREAYMQRVAAAVEAGDRHGAAVILSCFYQRQHSHQRALTGKEAIRRAVMSTALWIRRQGYTNVVLEISNEYRHNGYERWQDGAWLTSDEGQVELIRLARQTAPGLLVSTSGMGNGQVSPAIAEAADFLLIHFNNTALQDIPPRIADARRYGKPVVCNEDNKLGPAGAEAARLSTIHGAGWGFMNVRKNQNAPFEFDGAQDDPDVFRMLQELATRGPATAQSRPADLASILITRPKDGDTFPAGEPITICVAAAATGRTVARVEVFANNQRIGSAPSAPWQVTWQNPPAGRYDLVAAQIDQGGYEAARSNPVDIVVVQP